MQEIKEADVQGDLREVYSDLIGTRHVGPEEKPKKSVQEQPTSAVQASLDVKWVLEIPGASAGGIYAIDAIGRLGSQHAN